MGRSIHSLGCRQKRQTKGWEKLTGLSPCRSKDSFSRRATPHQRVHSPGESELAGRGHEGNGAEVSTKPRVGWQGGGGGETVARRGRALEWRKRGVGRPRVRTQKEGRQKTPRAQPDALMGAVRQGAVWLESGMPGCHEANGKCERHDDESGDRAPPSLGAPGSRTSPRSEGSGHGYPYLALQPSLPL